MGSGACWLQLARVLEHDFDVIMPDARGHGGSSAPPHGYRYDDLAGDVEGLLCALNLRTSILLGHSMGGMTAAVVASRSTARLRALILVDPTFLSPERQREVHASNLAAHHRRMLGYTQADLVAQARASNPRRPPELIELQAAARLNTSMSAFDVLTPPNPEYRVLMSAVGVPTLLVIGDTPVVTLETATELRACNARLRVEQIQNAGHGLPFDQPERLSDMVTAFVATVSEQDHGASG
jgi:pimeloyl-ACP methyl ester carboxylesterase